MYIVSAGANSNMQDKRGRTPLYLLCDFGDSEDYDNAKIS
jgi:hypothetical protein